VSEPDADRRSRFDALFEAHSADVIACCRGAGSASDAQDAI
jgi:hypothetical protein